MSGSFEIRNFFRKMPADLIHEYFAARHGITFGVPEEGSEQTEFDRQLADWKNLPQEIKVSAERDFIKINDMADEAGPMGGLPFEQACLLYVFAPLGTMGQCLLISPFGQSSSELVEKTQRVWTSESRNGAGSNRGFGKKIRRLFL